MADNWTIASARNLGKPARLPGLVEMAPRVDQFLSRVPLVPVDGYKVEYSQMSEGASRPTVGWLTPGGGGTYVSAGRAAPDGTNQTREMCHIEGVFDMPLGQQEGFSSLNDQVALQIEMKKRALREELGKQVFQGVGTNGQPYGVDHVLNTLDQSQTIATGGTITYAHVTDMLMRVQANNGQAHYIVANASMIKKYVAALVTAGVPPELVQLEGMDRPVLAHLGVPILRNDMIANSYANLGRIFAVVVGGEEGLRLCIPKEAPPDGIVVQTTTRPDTSNAFARVAMSVAVVIPSNKAVAACSGIQP